MKELQQHLKDKVELNVKKKQEVEYVLEGVIKPIIGHKIWEVNEETGEIKAAEYKSNMVSILPTCITPHEKLVIKPYCVYIPALNIQNARKKYNKNRDQSAYYYKEPEMKINLF